MKQLRKASTEGLLQCDALLQSIASGNEGLYAHSGIGRHVRHIADHFQALQDGLKTGLINYNIRQRDSELETNLILAREKIQDLVLWLETTSLLDAGNREISIMSEISSRETINTTIASNLKRELHYVTYHCIHHIAYCSLLAKHHGLQIDPLIGLAPGTATYFRAASS